jgi:hypothetical protein
MTLLTLTKQEITPNKYLLETKVYLVLTVWFSRRMFRFDRYIYYTILNA